jgi:hypothetical protein
MTIITYYINKMLDVAHRFRYVYMYMTEAQ